MKAEEKKTAEEELYASFAKLESEKRLREEPKQISASSAVSKNAGGNIVHNRSMAAIDEDYLDQMLKDDDDEEKSEGDIRKESSAILAGQYTQVLKESNAEAEVKYLPPPRTAGVSSVGKVDIIFTPRLFPTPMRASQAAEEEDWIAKNRKHLKKHGVFSKQLKSNF